MADRYWNGSVDGDWNTAANWTPAAVPLATENVFITETAVSIDGYDNSAVALGIVTFGPGFTGNIGAITDYLILNCGASQRITIAGAPGESSQEMWLDYDGSNTDIDIISYGTITAAAMATRGVHLKRTSGNVSVDNRGGPVTLDSGTFVGLTDSGSAVSVVAAGVTVSNYKCVSSSAKSTLNATPTAMTVSNGTVTVEGSATIINVEQFGGQLLWNGGSDISTLLTVHGGTFSTAAATVQATIADAVVRGTAATTTVNLSMATITNDIEYHGTPTMVFAGASMGTVT
jgi:hypothetical protein